MPVEGILVITFRPRFYNSTIEANDSNGHAHQPFRDQKATLAKNIMYPISNKIYDLSLFIFIYYVCSRVPVYIYLLCLFTSSKRVRCLLIGQYFFPLPLSDTD